MISLSRGVRPSPPPVVQEMHRPPAPILRYVDQVVGTGSAHVPFRFSQGVLTKFDIDVLHVAEEYLGRLLGAPDVDTPISAIAVAVLVRNLRKHNIALVRTLSSASSEPSCHRSTRWARSLLDKATDAFVVFDESTPTPDTTKTTVIPHAHYRDRFIGFPRGEAVQGRVLCVAPTQLAPATLGLLAIPRVADTSDLTLHIVGTATPSLTSAIESEAARRGRSLSTRFEALSDGAQVQEMDAAEIIIVPETQALEQHQTVFLALSLDRPVLTPRTEAMAHLSEQVGDGWVFLSDGPVTADALDTALARLRSSRRSMRPHLDGRALESTQTAYAAIFAEVARRRTRS